MAFVMGISSAQASLLNVQECFNDSSGVYAILNSPPFTYSAKRAFGKIGRGGYILWDELSIFIRHRVLVAIFFRGNLAMTTIVEMMDWRGRKRYLAELWIMKSGKIANETTMKVNRCHLQYSGVEIKHTTMIVF